MVHATRLALTVMVPLATTLGAACHPESDVQQIAPLNMSRDAFRSRHGVACITPGRLEGAFQTLPIGFYKDYHALGFAHHDAAWTERLEPSDVYLPTIQYMEMTGTDEVQDALREAAASGQFPIPEGLEIESMLALMRGDGLEEWLIQATGDGRLPRGTLLLLGNEPGYRPNHDPRTPTQIVTDGLFLRGILERHDLGHRIALGGASTPDNSFNRRAYGREPMDFYESILEEAASRGLRFESFVIHPYPLDGIDDPTTAPLLQDAAGLVQNSVRQIVAFRRLMQRYGHRDAELLVGEIGVPFQAESDVVTAYLDEMLTWCLGATSQQLGQPGDEHRLVQRVTWFMLALPAQPVPGYSDNPMLVLDNSVLLDAQGQLTALGHALIALADRVAPVE